MSVSRRVLKNIFGNGDFRASLVLIGHRGDRQLLRSHAGSTGRCNTPGIKLFSSNSSFSDLWEMSSAYSHIESDFMRCFDSRALVREIGCALGKARNVFHLKEVLRRPLDTTGQKLEIWIRETT